MQIEIAIYTNTLMETNLFSELIQQSPTKTINSYILSWNINWISWIWTFWYKFQCPFPTREDGKLSLELSLVVDIHIWLGREQLIFQVGHNVEAFLEAHKLNLVRALVARLLLCRTQRVLLVLETPVDVG